MSLCMNCGKTIPDGSKFCPYCGTPAAAAPVYQEPIEQEATTGAWYQSPEQTPPPEPVQTPRKPAIPGVFAMYGKALSGFGKKPFKLWGLFMFFCFVSSLILSLGAGIPLLSLPIYLVLSLGFTGILLNAYRGEEIEPKQLFRSFGKDEVVRNGAGMCWQWLWTAIWSFVPVMNIIKFYSYSFVPYILNTDKDISATEALRKSMRMTSGYKGKMFGAEILLIAGVSLATLILFLLCLIPVVQFFFIFVLFVFCVAVALLLPLFLGLLRTAFFDEISALHEEEKEEE